MSTRTIKRTFAIACLVAFAFGAVESASAHDQFMFENITGLADSQLDAAVAVATRRCDPANVHPYQTPAFQQCMLRQGWRYSHVNLLPDTRRRTQEDADLDKRNEDEANAAEQRRDEEMRNAEATRNMIQMNQQ